MINRNNLGNLGLPVPIPVPAPQNTQAQSMPVGQSSNLATPAKSPYPNPTQSMNPVQTNAAGANV